MLKALCRFLFLGALFVGCTCDIKCYVEKQFKRVPTVTPGTININVCELAPKEFDGIRSDAKECSTTKINVDKLEAFVTDICQEDGVLRQDFLKHKECFVTNAGGGLLCGTNVGIELKMETIDEQIETMKSICNKIDDIYKCVDKNFATKCGDEAGTLSHNVTDALASYTTGLCLEVNGASINQVLYINILLGLLCFLMMWHKS